MPEEEKEQEIRTPKNIFFDHEAWETHSWEKVENFSLLRKCSRCNRTANIYGAMFQGKCPK